MTTLMIVAGEVGRGHARYESGLFRLPDGSQRGAEAVAEIIVHGGVSERPSRIGQIVGGLKGGLALASNLDLPAPASLAATAIGAGLSTLDEGPQQKTLLEIRFLDGNSLVAMADVDLAPLIEHDRRVIQSAIPRFAEREVPGRPAPPADAGMGSRAIEAVSDAAGGALQVVSSAFGFVRNRTTG